MKHTPHIVVISDDEDAHIPYVQAHLTAPMQIVDPQTLLEGGQLSFMEHGKNIVAVYNGVVLDQVTGVWYRKPRNVLAEQLPVAADFTEYSLAALQALISQILTAFERATWVSDYYAIWKANNKAWQLEVAKSIGLRAPTTLFTSDKGAAEAFIQAQGSVIVKPLGSILPVVKGTPQTFFATTVSKQTMPDLRHLHLAPAIFQQAIDASFDIRVTVVGSKVFATAIHTANDDPASPIRDWRANQYLDTARIEPYDLPSDIAEKCIKHVKKLGLHFGALDFVADKRGQLWFLENNPNGQWAFVEKATGQPIGKAIADLLSRT